MRKEKEILKKKNKNNKKKNGLFLTLCFNLILIYYIKYKKIELDMYQKFKFRIIYKIIWFVRQIVVIT